MQRDYPERPIVGVGAVVVSDGKVVIVERSSEPRKGEWSIPGGVLEVGETLRQCAAREALEETGLQVEPRAVLDVFDSIFPDPEGRTRYHYVLVDFLCELKGGELRAGSDARQVRWISRDELGELKLSEPTRRVINKAFEEMTSKNKSARPDG